MADFKKPFYFTNYSLFCKIFFPFEMFKPTPIKRNFRGVTIGSYTQFIIYLILFNVQFGQLNDILIKKLSTKFTAVISIFSLECSL